jgi:hypothetical protein
MRNPGEQKILPEEEPRWGKAYGFVAAFFALEVLLLYLFTVRFS